MNRSELSRRSFCAGALGLGACVFARVGKPAISAAASAIAATILADRRLVAVHELGVELLQSGLRAGSTYPEVWIRDLNTFIEAALPVNDHGAVRQGLCNFLLLQGPEGDIVDGYVPRGKSAEPPYRTSAELPNVVAFKNTVESDQESSLVSAVRKYVAVTGDVELLDESIGGLRVRERLDLALLYLLKRRWDAERGLVWGGASVDWGDVQPEDYPGTHIDANSHRACSIYGNAMLVIAIRDLLALNNGDEGKTDHWKDRQKVLGRNIRRHLWDKRGQKFRPHVYLKGSPFPPEFEEQNIYYHGGTAIAIEAGILSRREISASLETMRRNVKAANAGSIGLTIYPTYPEGFYKDPILSKPYTYQNGGDWCWFGARMVQQLVEHGFAQEAYDEFQPMMDRVLKARDFYEWWSPANEPRGSGRFRGSAGVMMKAIDLLTDWAKREQGMPHGV